MYWLLGGESMLSHNKFDECEHTQFEKYFAVQNSEGENIKAF